MTHSRLFEGTGSINPMLSHTGAGVGVSLGVSGFMVVVKGSSFIFMMRYSVLAIFYD